MSESKAALRMSALQMAAELAKQEQDIVFLIQALLDIKQAHPEVELPDLGADRFRERVWRQVTAE